MRRALPLITLAALAALASSSGEADGTSSTSGKPYPGGPSCPSRTKRLLLVGDSLAVGLGPQLKPRAAACGVEFETAARVGSHTHEWPSQIDFLLAAAAPDAVLLSLGGNDYHAPPGSAAVAMSKVLGAIKARGASAHWIAPPPMPFEDRGWILEAPAGGEHQTVASLFGAPWSGYFPTNELSFPQQPDRERPVRC